MRKLTINFFKNLPKNEKKITVSTLFTCLRILLTPCIVFFIIQSQWVYAFWLFALAALTDTIDGNLARLRNEKTFLGACLDPIADKILILSSFITLALLKEPYNDVPVWFVMIICIKELVVLIGAIIIYTAKGYISIQPTVLGKLTTVTYMVFILGLLATYHRNYTFFAYEKAVIALTVLVIASCIQYVQIGFKQWWDCTNI